MPGMKAKKKATKGKTGPKPEVLKLNGKWEAAIKIAFTKKRPEKGWPKVN